MPENESGASLDRDAQREGQQTHPQEKAVYADGTIVEKKN